MKTPLLDALIADIKSVFHRKEGTIQELCEYLGGRKKSQIDEWITSRRVIPNGEITLQMQLWVINCRTGQKSRRRDNSATVKK